MLIILDRDGVINEDSENYIKSATEWAPIPGSLEAIAALNHAGYIVVIATNQSGIGRGLYSEQDLQRIHDKMRLTLAAIGGHIDGIFYCPHRPDENCNCRKPKPGLMLQIAEFFHTDFRNALFIGDAERDIISAKAVDCRAILVKTGKGALTLANSLKWQDVPVYDNLAAAVDAILTGAIGVWNKAPSIEKGKS